MIQDAASAAQPGGNLYNQPAAKYVVLGKYHLCLVRSSEPSRLSMAQLLGYTVDVATVLNNGS